MVESLETGHDRLADPHGCDFVAQRFHLPLNAAHKPINACRIDLALARCVTDRPGELLAIERLAFAVLLDNGKVSQLDTFERREARPARFALAPTANGGTVLARAA